MHLKANNHLEVRVNMGCLRLSTGRHASSPYLYLLKNALISPGFAVSLAFSDSFVNGQDAYIASSVTYRELPYF
jgi:hypothetical protein